MSVGYLALENDIELKELIRKAALINAVAHGGKAQAGAMIGKILGEKQLLRNRVSELSAIIDAIVNEVNHLSLEEQKKIVEKSWPETLKKEKHLEKHLSPLINAGKYPKITTRFSPNPDCVLHLGSARAIILSYEYAHLYNGKFILRFEDTDPKTKKPSMEFYDNIRKDLKWLGCRVDEEYVQSKRLPIYYEYAKQLLKTGNAYVCECLSENFRKKTIAMQACSCRDLPINENLERWDHMLGGGYEEGQAIVRVKTDLKNPNPAVRDWPALRIIDTKKYPHPLVGSKYIVWPLYNLAAGLDDHLMGITHIIRGKEHYTNMVRQKYMYDYLGWIYPEAIHYGRLKIMGAFLSKSRIVQGVKDGNYTGFDDPRLGTFVALRKRGITPEAIKRMIIDVGIKPNDVTLSWENLFSYNRKILDEISHRYFFVSKPLELKVTSVPKSFTAKLFLHPEKPELGFRSYTVTPKSEERALSFWISSIDAQSLERDKLVRLMELFNIKIESTINSLVTAKFVSESYEEIKRLKVKLIHWIPRGSEMQCCVVMPDASLNEGFAEAECKKLKPDTIIQFERFGFVRIDEVMPKLIAYFAHK